MALVGISRPHGDPIARWLAGSVGVEMYGGSLDLQSEVGVGTTVTVRFPAERLVSELATVAS